MTRRRLRNVLACSLSLVAIGTAGAASPETGDPWEPMNRGIFRFNEVLDIYALAPVARGWRFVTPAFVRTAIGNLMDLGQMPIVLANDILQLEADDAAQDVLRGVVNASFGIGGLVDVATLVEIRQNDEDFGQTLGHWGVPPGPYLVVPLLGPMTVRDGFGRILDSGGWYYFSLLPIWGSFVVQGVRVVNLRSYYIEEIDENRRESFDYYVFLRNAYLQNRRAKIGGWDSGSGEDELLRPSDEDLYYFDDEQWDSEEEPGVDENAPFTGDGSGGADAIGRVEKEGDSLAN